MSVRSIPPPTLHGAALPCEPSPRASTGMRTCASPTAPQPAAFLRPHGRGDGERLVDAAGPRGLELVPGSIAALLVPLRQIEHIVNRRLPVFPDGQREVVLARERLPQLHQRPLNGIQTLRSYLSLRRLRRLGFLLVPAWVRPLVRCARPPALASAASLRSRLRAPASGRATLAHGTRTGASTTRNPRLSLA